MIQCCGNTEQEVLQNFINGHKCRCILKHWLNVGRVSPAGHSAEMETKMLTEFLTWCVWEGELWEMHHGRWLMVLYSVTNWNNKLTDQLHGAEFFEDFLRFPVYATWPITTTTNNNNNNNNNNNRLQIFSDCATFAKILHDKLPVKYSALHDSTPYCKYSPSKV